MFRNYIKTAIRSIKGNKFYTVINIVGLTTGLIVGLFILLWVQDELSYDTFNSKAKNIYKVNLVGGTGISAQIFTVVIAPVATFAKAELPEVKDGVRIMNVGGNVPFRYKDKIFAEDHVAFVDPSLFSIFDFKLTAGNNKQPFTNDGSLVISRTIAQKYFGNEDPIGKVIKMGNDETFSVSGVIDDMPENSSVQYDIMIPMARFNRLAYQERETSYNGTKRLASMDADWSNFSFATYLLLNPNTNIKALQKKLQAIHERNKPEDAPVPYLAQPLSKVHLYKADGTNSGIETVKIFAVVALLILLIACINYVNLSTARAMLRAKEVSMRKIIGAGRGQLFMQFLMETAVLFLISAVLALALMFVLLPFYNTFAGKQLTMSLGNVQLWICIGLALLGTLAAASIYPAMLLSSFKPLQALKGKLAAGMGNVAFRRVLVVIQFSVSVMLIISTLIIGNQLNYVRKKSLGYNKENVLTFMMRNKMQPHYEAVKAELEKQPGIVSVTRSGGNMVNDEGFTGDIDWDGKPLKANPFFHPFYADRTLIPFFNIKMAEGANFGGSPADSIHLIINETAVREMGMTNPIGKRMRVRKTQGIITGVVKDFHIASMRKKIEPVVLMYQPQNAWRIYIKTTGSGSQQAVEAAQRIWKQYNDQTPLTYTFLDEAYTKLYQSEQRVAALSTLFAVVTIVLSCLGLLGLATYTAQVKTREIGIRKVLGASVTSVIQLLAKEFMVLVALSLCIAIPLAWYAMSQWLANYAYRTSIGVSVFLVASASALVIAFATVSVRSLKAAWANPVKSLRQD